MCGRRMVCGGGKDDGAWANKALGGGAGAESVNIPVWAWVPVVVDGGGGGNDDDDDVERVTLPARECLRVCGRRGVKSETIGMPSVSAAVSKGGSDGARGGVDSVDDGR